MNLNMLGRFRAILQEKAVTPLYQPIVDLHCGDIIGYEGLTRGPPDSPLHLPVDLFTFARSCGQVTELERLCHTTHVETFMRDGIEGKLFLNMSPDMLMTYAPVANSSPLWSNLSGIGPDNIVIELTESNAPSSYAALKTAVADYRSLGVEIAIDDLGEGFSSLRLWAELCPEYVKVDKYFIQDIDKDEMKRQFVRSIIDIARQSGTRLVAEGIETEAELQTVRKLGVQYGQGYLFARPALNPIVALAPEISGMLHSKTEMTRAVNEQYGKGAKARKIVRVVPAIADSTAINTVYEIFVKQADLQVLAILSDGVPIGLIHRLRLLDRLARPYHRELYGNKPCAQFIEHVPLIVDHNTSLQDLGYLFTAANSHHLTDGFIITEEARFIGVGTGVDLIREITTMQMDAARYANPLTQLPGNVPINEHIEALLVNSAPFSICYADLDSFKPFNDLYGYSKGDEVIQITADLLRDITDPDCDFIGHIGGDDFIVVFTSPDWRKRCEALLDRFPVATAHLYRAAHLAEGGYVTANRQGAQEFHALVSISLGVVNIDSGRPYTNHQVAEFAAQAKIEAKKIRGNSLFIERRALDGQGFAFDDLCA